jgi:hypothetical protein
LAIKRRVNRVDERLRASRAASVSVGAATSGRVAAGTLTTAAGFLAALDGRGRLEAASLVAGSTIAACRRDINRGVTTGAG